ncbi:CO8A1-like protein [Mya arenaria]|uniref:CO8A1-like protein n=1 Tax=Mya arenaria TaxID=6604 RepID=A0ABY7G6P4_MYAAR|nr:CO8A1-like protein [Mya arenaria]WAR29204.1 CO8A1-like protein [Mya arenaria]
MELQIKLLQKANKELKRELLFAQYNYNTGLTALETRIDELEAQRLANGSNNKIIFRATLSTRSLALSTVKTAVFDIVHENFGNAYNPMNGIFTPPLNGTYVFQISIGNPTGQPGRVFLKKNLESIEYVFAGYTSGWDQAGKTAFLYLEVGDIVYVEGTGHITGTYDVESIHSSFSGALMHVC